MGRTRRGTLGCCIAIVMFGAGCGKESPPPIVPAQGVVFVNGAPLPKAQVRFIPQIKLGPEYIATGVTDEQGKFTLQCNGQPGACASETIVTVAEADIPPQLQGENAQRELAVYIRSLKNRPIPPNYATPLTPLHLTVTEGQADYKLELKR